MNQHFTSTSRVLAALLFVAVTTESAAQSFPLPYNPDENGDGLIGVADLQGLLTNYGLEFSGAVLSEDGESAITYMGEMAYPLCALSCENLPGMWFMPAMEDLGLVWGEVYTTNSTVETWLKREQGQNLPYQFTSNPGTNPTSHAITSSHLSKNNRCFCVAKQLPRVEYSVCSYWRGGDWGAADGYLDCAEEKVANGWFPLGGLSNSDRTGGQAFWRWAE